MHTTAEYQRKQNFKKKKIMSKLFVFAGASSRTAIETAKLLRSNGHKVIGISTKEDTGNYDLFFKSPLTPAISFRQLVKPLTDWSIFREQLI